MYVQEDWERDSINSTITKLPSQFMEIMQGLWKLIEGVMSEENVCQRVFLLCLFLKPFMEKMKEGLVETIMRFADTLHHVAFYGNKRAGKERLMCERGWKKRGRRRNTRFCNGIIK